MSFAAVVERPSFTESKSQNLQDTITRATRALRGQQRRDGHFAFELEADATIPSEYILLKHFLGEPEPEIERKIGVYLRRIQGPDGGWALVHGGELNMSATVKAYFALKMIGDPIDAPHMARAREAVLQRGGAATSNVFTRNTLALFGEVPWRAVPVMPVEIMLLPGWFPFHLNKISYWARTTLVPMMVLAALKPRARNPRGVTIRELFVTPPEAERHWPTAQPDSKLWGRVFGAIDAVLQRVEPLFPKSARKRAIDKAVAFTVERLNGEDGLGAIYPAMANSVMMFELLGFPLDSEAVKLARASIEKLMVVGEDEAYCQPCLSPVWDTALAAQALIETGFEGEASAERSLDWLIPRQVLDVVGDWAHNRPGVRPGGWAFQYENPHYPDLDDTAVVVMAMDRLAGKPGGEKYNEAIARGREWVVGLQSKNGGWGAFEADNVNHYLNAIPFADHGALLDPPTADVTARCVGMLAQLGERPDTSEPVRRGVDYLIADQEKDGSWFGRWGVNYIYGTWSVLCALNAAGLDHGSTTMRRAVAWLLAIQNADGGWGESDQSYEADRKGHRAAPSTASQTAWATLGLMAAGEIDNPAVKRGIDYLMAQQGDDGQWPEEEFTGTGFARVFYLRYHGYSKFFPLWATARYRNLKAGNTKTVMVGM
ncbi:squalene--hopene cyclase [Lichenihabitans sp. Uapishka_5]|uniref:squalene--hopene cyclase n=1 Tax=Lichenihabitans sp. Uapishka_5 TaxID=3037302 RepID=UPI0029E8048F|nr:squalene--hopene cyclase [Lichenihabitans sp. Uapishka_5]MDX7953220.1 squalene--hopene cyclase [Lichenihabitans sp. Uapishka_5]